MPDSAALSPSHIGAVDDADAIAFVDHLLNDALRRCPEALALSGRLLDTCGVRLRDLIDHISAPCDRETLAAHGWSRVALGLWRHPARNAPDIHETQDEVRIALRVDCVERFLRAHRIDALIAGARYGQFRRAEAFRGESVRFEVVERHGWDGAEPPAASPRLIRRARLHLQTFRARRRHFRSSPRGLYYLDRLVDAAAADLSPEWAASLFLQAEREHWALRCAAGAAQARRQEAAGIGWCNIDHHAFNTSRDFLPLSLAIFERLGFRPSAHAATMRGAGWGAIVLEQPGARVLLNVDLAAHESIEQLTSQDSISPASMGRAGIWCAMHGESLLEGGLDHIAASYDVTGVRDLLLNAGAEVRESASPARILAERTQAEIRAVDPSRVDGLRRSGVLATELAENFKVRGVAAAHMAMIERNSVADYVHARIDDELTRCAAEPPAPQPRFRHRVRRRPARVTTLS